jgi:hypothetical protein
MPRSFTHRTAHKAAIETQTRTLMKLHLPILTAALLFTGLAITANAADTKPVYNSKGQLIAVVPTERAPARPSSASGPAHYVAFPSGKGGAVTPVKHSGDVTSIAVFKSKAKEKAKCSSCCQ